MAVDKVYYKLVLPAERDTKHDQYVATLKIGLSRRINVFGEHIEITYTDNEDDAMVIYAEECVWIQVVSLVRFLNLSLCSSIKILSYEKIIREA